MTFAQEGIAHILRDHKLRVPIYQRSYSWEKEQITDFWKDLRQALVAGESPAPEYFLGTVVLTPSEVDDSFVVIDGQQRLATVTMVLAAIRNIAVQRDDNLLAAEIGPYLANLEVRPRHREYRPHLHLNREDDDFFLSYVVQPPQGSPPQPGRPSQSRIKYAFDVLSGWLSEEVDKVGEDWAALLSQWQKFLDGGAFVIRLTVPDEAHAYRIFETLNDRGLDLTTADLLKNYLFGQADDRLDSIQQAWTETIAVLDSEALLKKFLRHYWNARHVGIVRDRQLYDEIREEVKRSKKAYDFTMGLRKAARLYAALVHRDNEYWADWEPGAQRNVDTLFRLGLEQHRPLLLAAMEQLNRREVLKLLSALVSWSFRGLVVGGIGTGQTEAGYAGVAAKIFKGEVRTTRNMYEELRGIIPSDESFGAAFSTYSPPTNSLARYCLLALERHAQGDPQAEFIPNAAADEVNLEHVLPVNPNMADWPRFKADQIRDLTGRLGNLALLKERRNAQLGNKPFNLKAEAFRRSSLKLTAMIGTEDEWSPGAIAERQKVLANMAVSVWPREPAGR